MMPGYSATQNEPVNYKKKYTALKRKLKLLVYEQECFVDELKKAQRKLLKVTRDRSFLLDRLCQYEKTEDTSSDSDTTASSDSDNEAGGKDTASNRRRKANQSSAHPQMNLPASSLLGSAGYSAMLAAAQAAQAQAAAVLSGGAFGTTKSPKEPAKKKQKVAKKSTKAKQSDLAAQLAAVIGRKSPAAGSAAGHMTREELERHLEMKTSAKPQFMSIDKAPHSLPDDIFSHDNSNPDSNDFIDRIKSEEEAELIIDVPQ